MATFYFFEARLVEEEIIYNGFLKSLITRFIYAALNSID